MSANTLPVVASRDVNGSLLLGTGLAFASLILVPAVATRLGMGAALTGAMRIALMRASNRAVSAAAKPVGTTPARLSHH